MRAAMLLVVAVALYGCAGEEPETATEQPEPAETAEEREDRLDHFTRATCEEFRTMVAELDEGPTQQRVDDRLTAIRGKGGLASDEMRGAVSGMSEVGTAVEAEAWFSEVDRVCTESGY